MFLTANANSSTFIALTLVSGINQVSSVALAFTSDYAAVTSHTSTITYAASTPANGVTGNYTITSGDSWTLTGADPTTYNNLFLNNTNTTAGSKSTFKFGYGNGATMSVMSVGASFATTQGSTDTVTANYVEVIPAATAASTFVGLRFTGYDETATLRTLSLIYKAGTANTATFATTNTLMPVFSGGANAGNFGTTNNCFNIMYAQTGFTTVSDESSKTNVVDCPYGLDLIETLSPKMFKYLNDDGTASSSSTLGLLAQDLWAALGDPQLDLTMVKPPTGIEKWAISYSELIPVLIVSIQQLLARVKQLES